MKKTKWLLSTLLILTLTNCGSGDSDSEVKDTDPKSTIESSDSLPSLVKVSSTLASIIKKTGQSQSYDKYGNEILDGTIKDDGYYQTGVEHSYDREGNTVIDNITRLMWQDNKEAKTATKPWITRENSREGKYDDTTGDTAVSYCENLTLDNYSDWRLPTVRELHSIYNNGQHSLLFENIALHPYWSSTTHNSIGLVVWSQGEIGNSLKLYRRYIRCVRDNK